MATSPMMQQYQDAKGVCGDALLLFRMGDFYELFFDDARIAAEKVGLTLTSRDKNSDNPVPMAGFPHHQLDGYLAKLIGHGLRVAICEQIEDPKQAKGLVKRDITRVVSPGTLTDDALLDPRESNYLAAIATPAGTQEPTADTLIGVAWIDLSTGSFYAAAVPRGRLRDELARIGPAECLLNDDCRGQVWETPERTLLTFRAPWEFSYETAMQQLTQHFGTQSLEGFGFGALAADRPSPKNSSVVDPDIVAIRAAGAVMGYLRETQRASLQHIDRLVPYRSGDCLEIDQATRRSLEITRTLRDGQRQGSLLSVIDRSVTAAGSRLLADWISSPLTDVAAIHARLDAVEEFIQSTAVAHDLQVALKAIYDLPRLLARVATGRCSPRDLRYIGQTLQALPEMKERIGTFRCPLVQQLEQRLELCPELRDLLLNALQDECPLLARDGDFIRAGYHPPLDELRQLATGGKEWIARYQAEQLQATGISNLKVGFNSVFGYYIEITNTHREKIPAEYIRKQTLKNAERYITPELKEYEEKVLTADEKAKALEYDLFVQLRDAVQQAATRLQSTADTLAHLDVLLGLADLARRQGYCRPDVVTESVLQIVDGRHPVLDIVEPQGTFVPNDTLADEEHGYVLLITGPNMAGKSTYIRQVALLTLMAQAGSFIPARRATIGVADRIFARVGASDELSKGQSTFMVEMTETARILNTATARSLVILDEIGRGTSTYDGLSLAWAIVEHLHDETRCRTLFATHYHELTDLRQSLPRLRNLNVAVKEWQENVVFLHKIIEGAADKSYGIHVARLAGVPARVNERAKQILARLEDEHVDGAGRTKIPPPHLHRARGDIQLTLFGPTNHPVIDDLRALDVNQMTPVEALLRIQQLKEQAMKN